MNSSIRPFGNRPNSRGPCPCFEINSNVWISLARSKKTSTPSPQILTRTFREVSPVLVGHLIWQTSLVIAPLSGMTCNAFESVTLSQLEANDSRILLASPGKRPALLFTLSSTAPITREPLNLCTNDDENFWNAPKFLRRIPLLIWEKKNKIKRYSVQPFNQLYIDGALMHTHDMQVQTVQESENS